MVGCVFRVPGLSSAELASSVLTPISAPATPNMCYPSAGIRGDARLGLRPRTAPTMMAEPISGDTAFANVIDTASEPPSRPNHQNADHENNTKGHPGKIARARTAELSPQR
jgi:hypothetical protein